MSGVTFRSNTAIMVAGRHGREIRGFGLGRFQRLANDLGQRTVFNCRLPSTVGG
jgi:hypothetical protein